MTDIKQPNASIRIFDLNLANVVAEILAGQNLPIEKKFIAPRAGGLCEHILDEINRRAETVRHELFASHTLTAFSSGEHKIEYNNTVAGRKVFVVLDFPTLDETKVSREVFQIVSATLTNNYIFIAKEAADAARRAGAAEVHLFIPNFAYARQDKTHKKRGPISAAIVARDLEDYFDTITSLHLHSPAIEGMLHAGKLVNISPNEIFAPNFVCRDPDSFQPIDISTLTVEGVNRLFSLVCIVT
jgi:phosphoribosylpyrophosphate synthetase